MPDNDDDLEECANCGGKFVECDLNWEGYCHDCADELAEDA